MSKLVRWQGTYQELPKTIEPAGIWYPSYSSSASNLCGLPERLWLARPSDIIAEEYTKRKDGPPSNGFEHCNSVCGLALTHLKISYRTAVMYGSESLSCISGRRLRPMTLSNSAWAAF